MDAPVLAGGDFGAGMWILVMDEFLVAHAPKEKSGPAQVTHHRWMLVIALRVI
jgi:hypothetical protein